ncbi:MAG: 8-oxo-dGTP diphosphatase [Clostridiales bacterium]|jgi:8-oxo-dGTP diphosphatase|nr:8-oxo-dGTP diphosphatase [Clostridiales bacterium]
MAISEIVVTNMVMVEDKAAGKVLAQRRTKSWCGVAFPGGHLENGESLEQSAIREVYEETGLVISELKFCGIVHWTNADTGYNELIFYYSTSEFKGELTQSDEGENFWVTLDELRLLDLSPGFETQLELFLNDNVHELLIKYDDSGSPLIHQWF